MCIINLFAQENVNITDSNFLQVLIKKGIDLNNDGKIQVSEAEKITNLNINNESISDLTGIESFTELVSFFCNDNQLTLLDFQKNTKLSTLYCDDNQLTNINLSKNTALKIFHCTNNKLSHLDLTQNTSLGEFYCQGNVNLSNVCLSSLSLVKGWGWVKDNTTTYSETCTIVATTKYTDNSTRTIIKTYDLQGQEISINTKNKIIILLYEDGTIEKIFQD